MKADLRIWRSVLMFNVLMFDYKGRILKISQMKISEKLIVLSFLFVSLSVGQALQAQSPAYYDKKDSFLETLIVSRETRMRQNGVNIPKMQLPDFGASEFTIETWIKTTSDYGVIFNKAPERWDIQGKCFFIFEGKLTYDVGWVGNIITDQDINDGQWHHVALTGIEPYDFFLDGEKIGSGSFNNMAKPDIKGHIPKIGDGTLDFPENAMTSDMILDELGIYNRRLTDQEILELSQLSSRPTKGLVGYWKFDSDVFDFSGNENHGSLKGAPYVDGKKGKALNFDQVFDYVSLNHLEFNQDDSSLIFSLIQNDFNTPAIQRQIAREINSKIWQDDWEPGRFDELGSRYQPFIKNILDYENYEETLFEEINSFEKLKKIHELFHSTYIYNDVLLGLMSFVRNEINYLSEEKDESDQEWLAYVDRYGKLAKRVKEYLSGIKSIDQLNLNELIKWESEILQFHSGIPLTFPVGPEGKGPFGAYPTSLKYGLKWDATWRSISGNDLVIQFDRFDYKMIFWRGLSRMPYWVTENELLFTHGSVVVRNDSVLNDTQSRYSNVQVLENSDARCVVHWRYLPIDENYHFTWPEDKTDWGSWVDEFYTIYPNGLCVRKIVFWYSKLSEYLNPIDENSNELLYYHDPMMIFFPGTNIDDVIESEFVTVMNMSEETDRILKYDSQQKRFVSNTLDASIFNPSIQMINLKSKYKPYSIIMNENNSTLMPFYEFNMFDPDVEELDLWPVAQDRTRSDIVPGQSRPWPISFGGFYWPYYNIDKQHLTKVMLVGLTDKPITQLIDIAESWIDPPVLLLLGGKMATGFYENQGYDPTESAYKISRLNKKTRVPLNIKLVANSDTPVREPALVIENWGHRDVELKINNKPISKGKEYRVGYRKGLRTTDCIIWLDINATEPLLIEFVPGGKLP